MDDGGRRLVENIHRHNIISYAPGVGMPHYNSKNMFIVGHSSKTTTMHNQKVGMLFTVWGLSAVYHAQLQALR